MCYSTYVKCVRDVITIIKHNFGVIHVTIYVISNHWWNMKGLGHLLWVIATLFCFMTSFSFEAHFQILREKKVL